MSARGIGFGSTIVVTLVAALALAGCSATVDERCPDGLAPFTEFNFYFGLAKGDGGLVSEAEWDAFLADTVTPRFPDSLTVYDARGQWLDTAADQLYREPTKVLNILAPRDDLDASLAALNEIADVFVERFDQQVVFRTTRAACAGF